MPWGDHGVAKDWYARVKSRPSFRPLLAEHHLTEQQWRVLRALTAANHPLDAGDIAQRTFLLAPSLSRILAKLEARGMIERQPDPTDQRRSLITLSPAGLETVHTVAPESEHRYGEIEAAFGAERLHHLLRELHELARIDAELETRGAA